MDSRRKLDLSNEADPVAWRCNTVRLCEAESKMRSLDILTYFFNQFRKELCNHVVRGEALQVIHLKKLLTNYPCRIEIEETGMCHSFGHSLRFQVKNLEGSKHLRVRVAQERKVDLVPVCKALQDGRAIVTDRRQLDPLLLESWFRLLQLDELRFAEGSPVGRAEEKKNSPLRSPQGLV